MIECPTHALLPEGRPAEDIAVQKAENGLFKVSRQDRRLCVFYAHACASLGGDLNAYIQRTDRLCWAELCMCGNAGAAVQVSEPG